MRPAFSVILLTTLIGAGQGLFLAAFAAESYAALGGLPPVASKFLAAAGLLALALLIAGLVASFFHLGRPERAWRAAARWRTSWLSREVIALPAFIGAVAVYTLLHLAGAPLHVSLLVGTLGSMLAFILFVCTAMIYACLPFMREWNTPLTVFNYILLGGASGFTLAAALAAGLLPERAGFFVGGALLCTLAGLAGRLAALRRNARLKPVSTVQTALGIRHPHIVQKTRGAVGGSFNTREFFHGQSAFFIRRIKAIVLLCAFIAPCALLVIHGRGFADATPSLLASAFLIQYLGLLAERWLFFAQANHPQNLYYQCVS